MPNDASDTTSSEYVWQGPIAYENKWTIDGRKIEDISWRKCPMAVLLDGKLCGRVVEISKADGVVSAVIEVDTLAIWQDLCSKKIGPAISVDPRGMDDSMWEQGYITWETAEIYGLALVAKPVWQELR